MSNIKNSLVEAEQGGFAVSADLSNSLSEEMAGLNLSFDKIKVPSGGGLAFEISSDDVNNQDGVKEIKAVILYHHPVQSYYKKNTVGQMIAQIVLHLMDKLVLTMKQVKLRLAKIVHSINLAVEQAMERLARVSVDCFCYSKTLQFQLSFHYPQLA